MNRQQMSNSERSTRINVFNQVEDVKQDENAEQHLNPREQSQLRENRLEIGPELVENRKKPVPSLLLEKKSESYSKRRIFGRNISLFNSSNDIGDEKVDSVDVASFKFSFHHISKDNSGFIPPEYLRKIDSIFSRVTYKSQEEFVLPRTIPVTEIISRIGVVLNFLRKKNLSAFLEYRNQILFQEHGEYSFVVRAFSLDNCENNKSELPLHHSIHLGREENIGDYNQIPPFELLFHEIHTRQVDRDFLNCLERRWSLLSEICEDDISKFCLLDGFLASKRTFDSSIVFKYSQACRVISKNQFGLFTNLQESLLYWRFADNTPENELCFLNLIDNLLCFLCFEIQFPNLFSAPMLSDEQQNRSALEKYRRRRLTEINSSGQKQDTREKGHSMDRTLSDNSVLNSKLDLASKEIGIEKLGDGLNCTVSKEQAARERLSVLTYGFSLILIIIIGCTVLASVMYNISSSLMYQSKDLQCSILTESLSRTISTFSDQRDILGSQIAHSYVMGLLDPISYTSSDPLMIEFLKASEGSALFVYNVLSNSFYCALKEADNELFILEKSESNSLVKFAINERGQRVFSSASTIISSFDPLSQFWAGLIQDFDHSAWTSPYTFPSYHANDIGFTHISSINETFVVGIDHTTRDIKRLISLSNSDNLNAGLVYVLSSNKSSLLLTTNDGDDSERIYSAPGLPVSQSLNPLITSTIQFAGTDESFRTKSLIGYSRSINSLSGLNIQLLVVSSTLNFSNAVRTRIVYTIILCIATCLSAYGVIVFSLKLYSNRIEYQKCFQSHIKNHDKTVTGSNRMMNSIPSLSSSKAFSQKAYPKRKEDDAIISQFLKLSLSFLFFFFIMLSLLWVIWYLWSRLASDFILPLSDGIVRESATQFLSHLTNHLSFCIAILKVISLQISNHIISHSGASLSEEFFIRTMAAISVSNASIPIFSSLFFVDHRDVLQGSQMNPSDLGNSLSYVEFFPISTDSQVSSILCFREYKTDSNFRRVFPDVFSDCSYSPEDQIWYNNAKTNADQHMLSDLYQTSAEKKIQVALSVSLRSENDEHLGILASELNIEFFQSFVGKHLSSSVDSEAVSQYLMDSQSMLIASSKMNISKGQNSEGIPYINASLAGPEDLIDTLRYLKEVPSNTFLNGLTSVDRFYESPSTYFAKFDVPNLTSGWQVLVIGSEISNAILSEENRVNELIFVICFMIFLFMMFVSSVFFELLSESRERSMIFEPISRSQLTSAVAIHWYKKMYTRVTESLIRYWQEDAGFRYLPILNEKLSTIRYLLAVERFTNASLGQDVNIACHMSKKSRTLYQLYSWNGGLLNYIILRAVLISHFLIDFYLPSTNTQLKLEGIPISLAILESLLIVFEVFEIVCRIILIIPSLEVEDTIFNIRNRAILIFLSLIFVVLICFDHITSLSIGFSFEFYIPLKIPLAIFLIDEVAVVLQAFFHSLRQATQVFLLYGCLLFVAALWGLLVFRDAINPETFKNSFGTFFRSLITAFIYMSSGENFTQVVFQSVEYNTIASIFSIIFELLLFHTDFLSIVFYFLTLTVLGTFFTLALMLSFFEEGFLSTFRSKLREKRLRKRLGLLSSFILMDIDHSGTVDLPEFRSFIQEINPLVTDEQVESIFRKLNVHESSKGRPTLSVLEFVVGVEKSSKLRISNSNFDVDRIRKDFNAQAAKMVNRSISQKVINPSKVHSNFMKDKKIVQLEGVEMSPVMSVDPPVLKSKPARRVRILASESSRLKARRWLFAVFSHPVYNHLILVTLFIYLCVVSLYGAVVEESILNYIAGSIMLIFVIEISLKIFVYGYAFFFWSRFNWWDPISKTYIPGDTSDEFANRFESFIVYTSFTAFILTRIFQADSRWNFILALPTLRIFFRVPTFRDLVVALIVIVPRFTAMFVLIFLVFYFYAVYGVLFFSSTWPILGSVAPKANFDTLSDAFLALAQIMIGEAWEEIMYAAMMATKVLYPAWFFISFVFIVTLLLTNAIVGMILTTTDSIVRSQRTRGKLNSDDIRELLLEN